VQNLETQVSEKASNDQENLTIKYLASFSKDNNSSSTVDYNQSPVSKQISSPLSNSSAKMISSSNNSSLLPSNVRFLIL
jgi:hypothetical protein